GGLRDRAVTNLDETRGARDGRGRGCGRQQLEHSTAATGEVGTAGGVGACAASVRVRAVAVEGRAVCVAVGAALGATVVGDRAACVAVGAALGAAVVGCGVPADSRRGPCGRAG